MTRSAPLPNLRRLAAFAVLCLLILHTPPAAQDAGEPAPAPQEPLPDGGTGDGRTGDGGAGDGGAGAEAPQDEPSNPTAPPVAPDALERASEGGDDASPQPAVETEYGAAARDPRDLSGKQPLELTLAEARRLAIDSNIELEIADVGVEVARFNARGSWGVFDPVFNLSVRYEDAQTQLSNQVFAGVPVLKEERLLIQSGLAVPVTTGGSFSLGYVTDRTKTNSTNTPPELTADALSLGFTQPLLRGAWDRAATADQRAFEFQARRQEELLREQRLQLLLAVENAYWDLVAALDQLEVREQSVRLFERQSEEESERLRVGVGTEVDLLQAETNVAVERERLLFAQTDVETRSDALRQLILRREAEDTSGRVRENSGWTAFITAWDAPIVPLTKLPEPTAAGAPPTWERSLADAYERRAELAAQRWEIEARRARLDLTRSLRKPGLDLTVDTRSAAFDTSSSGAFDSTAGFDSPTYGIGLAFELPIGNRSARFAERAARAELRSAHLELERIERTVLSEVRAAVRDVVYRREAVEAARRSRELAQRQLESEEVRYREGLSTTFQLLQFQQDLATALSNERFALANYAKAVAALLRAEGRIGEVEAR